ncbi:hypothetical protein [Kamptonema sp. UHCC 0994]|nr:hypothetical protein [Kamptonema sp. UHCC 0994]MDF0554020.1 hypothetical protein [Kamptonema sp. UHCC 0994]
MYVQEHEIDQFMVFMVFARLRWELLEGRTGTIAHDNSQGEKV